MEVLDLSSSDVFRAVRLVAPHLRRINGLLRPLIHSRSRLHRLSRIDRESVYLNLAISEVLTVIVEVIEKKFELDAVLWRLDNRDIGLCAKSENALLEMQVFVKCFQIPRMQNALELLKLGVGGGRSGEHSAAEGAIDELQGNIDLLASTIGVSCS